MDTPDDILEKIQKLIDSNSNYKFEAYSFVMAALHFTMSSLKKPRHVSGQELCEGIKRYALDQFGPLAGTVLEHWGIRETLDFGCIVFALVDAGLMRKTEEDSLDDFKDVYDFKAVFSSKLIFES